MKAVEVLAPAGGWDALEAGVRSGADAVYLGGPAFGARASAKNFTREELEKAAAFCHARGVRLHVTVNTLLKDRELPQAVEFVRFLCSLPVDAVLVQDLGLFAALRRLAPELPLHCSTQMSLHTPAGVRLLWELGASRVVLAREMSLREIREVRDSCPVELEAFVHGALCMSVSGQCYLSAMLGGRSGNRGMCAQPCRLPFAAPGGTGHDLSLKDLSLLERAQDLTEAGVCSLKIEGRMKRPEYVAAAVSACRLAAGGEAVPQELSQDLEAVFSRSGFTQGYLTGALGRGMFGTRRKEDVTAATEQVFSKLRGLYRRELPRVPVDLTLEEQGGEGVLTASDREGRQARAAAPLGDPGLLPLPRERCRQQLEKMGGTPFYPGEIALPEEGLRLGVGALNSLRRQVLEDLLEQRSWRQAIPMEGELPPPRPRKRPAWDRLPARACFRKVSQVPEQAKACRELCLPLGTNLDALDRLREQGFPPVLLELPRAMFGGEEQVRARMREAMDRGYQDFTCGNLGALALCRELGARAHGTFSLNAANSWALDALEDLGLATAECSFELTGRELHGLSGSLPRGGMVYGRQALMLVRNCPLANGPQGCRHCKEPGALTDRKGKKFPVLCERIPGWSKDVPQGGAEVFNSVPLWLGDREEQLGNLDFGVFRFTVENSVESAAVLEAYFRQEALGFDYTRGLFSRGVE